MGAVAGLLGLLVVLMAFLIAAPGAGGTPKRVPPRTPSHLAARPHSRLAIYRDRSYSFAERAADLVARMTTAEQASQAISSRAPAIPRLGVESYGWWNEALHGVSRLQLNPSGPTSLVFNTMDYPVDLALGSTWDPSLVYTEASAISDEAREVAPQNSLNLDFNTPTINLGRDPRWGRNEETFSEDPLLTARLGAQYVDGLQGQDQAGRLLAQGGGYLKAIATLKHFPADNSEADRLSGSSQIDERTLREYYTAPFRQIVQQSHPGGVMSAFRAINGTPAPASVHLNDVLARETFGFRGYLSSDCDAVDDIVAGHHWQPPGFSRPANSAEARALANAAGEDLNCNVTPGGPNYANLLPAAAQEGISTPTGTYTVNDLERSLVRLFTARMELGEFDNVSREPWVLDARAQLGVQPWINSDANHAVTETQPRLELAREAAEHSFVLLRNAVTRHNDGSTGPVLPIRVPPSGPFRVAVIGALANPAAMYLGGYASAQGPSAAGNQVTPFQGIRSAILAINPAAVVDFYSGFTGGSSAVGLTNIDPAAVSAASGYNDVIVYAGTDRSTAQENYDRSVLSLPGAQAQLIQEVAAKNPNTIAVMQTLGQVDLSGLGAAPPALLWSSFTGQRTGDGLAAVLLGSYNPSGHLPFTWYQSAAQLPPVNDYAIRPGPRGPGRTYMYFRGPVTYPFGYGLSYTTFRDSGLQIDRRRLRANDAFHVSVAVTNTGQLVGTDLVQLYVTSPGSPGSPSRPTRRLEGFTQVTLAPGQTRSVTLKVHVPDLAFFNQALNRFTVDDGTYWALIASSAAPQDVQLQEPFAVTGKLDPVPSAVSASPAMAGDAGRGIQARVMFPTDVAVQPNLSVSMNDDSLYGRIAGGRARPLPRGAIVRFASNRPGVVAVEPGGGIRTLANGVATVTATVTYGGASASTRFVIRVLSELDQLAIGTVTPSRPPAHRPTGRRPRPSVIYTMLPGFAPDRFSYQVTVSPGGRAPRITAASPDPRATVRIGQAGQVPGMAQATVTGPDGISRTYSVYFAYPPRSDEFSGPGLGPQWTWVRPDSTAEALASGSLVISPEAGALSGSGGPARNLLVQPALGDWTIASKLTFSAPPSQSTQQAGILAYQDDGDYLKLAWQYSFGAARFTEITADRLSGGVVTQTLVSLPTSPSMGDTIWLRMVKRGSRYTAYYSVDGVRYAELYSVGASLSNVSVGLFAVGGEAPRSQLQVSFDWFRVQQHQP